jgi:urease accessory protein
MRARQFEIFRKFYNSKPARFNSLGETLMRYSRLLITTTFLVLFAGSASAHTGAGISGGFFSGFMHPILGWDHVVAMVAVGLWGAFLGRPAIWILPVVFPLVMAFGGALGVMGVPIPAVETGIAASAVVLGAMVAFATRPPIWIAAVIVGAFAIFHGHAHGTELPDAANPLAYSLGFVIATGLLHLTGIAFGLLVRWPAGKVAVQTGGGIIALAGVGFLTGIV